MSRTKTPAKRKRGMLKGIAFDEVSFVGKGANQGANVSIIKMEDPKEVAKRMFSEVLEERLAGQEFRDFANLLYNEQSALMEAVDSIVYSNKEDKKQAILESLQQFVQAFASSVNDTGVIKSLEGLQKELGGTENQNQEVNDVKKGIEYYQALAIMTDIQKGIFESMTEDEKLEVIGKASDKTALAEHFKAMADKKKKKDGMKKSAPEGDESFQMQDGTTVAKSIVGDAAFLMLKSMNERLEKSESETAIAQTIAKEERDKRIAKELADEAEALWPNLPGTPMEKGQVLKSIRELPEAIQKHQMEMMASGNASNSALFKEHGGRGGDGSTPSEKLTKMANEHATATGISFHKAYDAIIQTPEGKKLYEESLN